MDVFGPNDQYLNLISGAFPHLRITARGNQVKVLGEPQNIELFEEKFFDILEHIEKFKRISENDLAYFLEDNRMEVSPINDFSDEIILHGQNGLVIKARTPNQRVICEKIRNHDMLFAVGPAGSGKTYTAVALAVKALKSREVKRIILTRPAVEAGENLGFLPGDLKDKLDPYLQPLYDALRDMIPPEKLRNYLETGTIQIAPLAFMRGRTLENAFVILDEAQNATRNQMKMFLTRMGMSTKFVITGDMTQIDLPRNQPSGLIEAVSLLKKTEGVAIVNLTGKDIVRNPLVSRILKAYDESKQTPTEQKP
ncbi:MAG: PhoH family protein [Bacteroidia bacterium]|nr:PhoH family protein [Bacteroidia bacterium]